MTHSLNNEAVTEYTDIAGSGDHLSAIRFVDDLISDSQDIPALLRDLVSPSQELVGLRWQTGAWNVGQEHAATATTNRVLAHLSGFAVERPARPMRLIVAVAESDWHSTGASVVAIGLRCAGFDVVRAPTGTSAGQLAALVHDIGPAAVVITCSLPSLLPGARRLVVAAQDAGTPVIAGGRAFGTNPRRAQLVGANGWAGDVTASGDVVRAQAGFSQPSYRFEHASTADYARIRQRLGPITERMRATLTRKAGPEDEVLDSALFLLRSLLSSLLIDDETVLQEDLAWALSRNEHGGPPVSPALSAIRQALSNDTPTALSLLESVSTQLTSAGGK